jgi:hypothetical protein
MAVLVLLGGMYYSYSYAYPSGQAPDILYFILFWARELLLLVFFVGVMAVVCLVWMREQIRKREAQKNSTDE